MNRPRRLPALLCALALVCALILPVWGVPSTPVYLLAANDKFCDLPGGALPVAINGIIYIPYSTFDRNLTGVDLGVYYGITPEHGTVLTLYSVNRSALTFHLNKSQCEDDQGNLMNFSATTRNNIPYVPASAVCNFFGLQYSFLPTVDRGTAIRISNPSSPHMDDSTFLSSARSAMTTRYNQVLQSLSPHPSAAVTPSSAPTPAISRPPAGNNEDIRIYLSLDASQWTGELTGLFPNGVHALLLFTPDSLSNQSALIRKAVAAGHSVGILLDGSMDAQSALAELDRANDLLSHIARIKTRTVSLSGPSASSLGSALEAADWVLWRPNLRSAIDSSTIQTVLGTRPATFRIDLTATPASSLSRITATLQREGYDLRRPLETEL